MASEVASLTAGLTPQQLALLKYQNHDAEVYVCSAVFSALAVLTVLVRVTSRHMKSVAVGIDDMLVILALIITLTQTTYICVGVREYGLGRHVWTLNKEQFIGFNKLWYTVGTLQCTALLLTKISLLMLFHRIFVTPTFRQLTKIIGGIMIVWWIATILTDTLNCIPIEYNWNKAIEGHCGNKQLVAKIPPIPSIITDLVILLMPIPMVWKLQLPRLQRIGLASLFLLGSFAVVSSCVRYSTLFFQRADVTYYIIPATIWTIIESNAHIISACLIVSRPWLIKLYPSKLISLVRTRSLSIRKNSKSSPASSTDDQRRPSFTKAFSKPSESPPSVISASLGAPFVFDVEKGFHSNRNSDAA